MRDGFVKVAAVTPKVTVADPEENRIQIWRMLREAVAHGAKVVVFPELAITGYTCGDLFSQKLLLERAYDELMELISGTEGMDAIVFVGTPWLEKGNYGQTLTEASDDLSRFGDLKANRRDKIPAPLSKIALLDAEMSQMKIE